MTFAQPMWLWIGAAACAVLALLMVRAERARRRAIRRLAAAGPATSVAPARRWMRDGLALAGAAFACLALARPRAGYHWEATPRRGIDLMFAVDTSKSMRAADLAPDRLTRAKLAVADLVRTFDNDRVGLVAFAGDAFVQAPMTADRTVFLEALDALDVDTIPTPGTDLASAIRAADQAMKSEPDHAKVLVLLSDGEDLAGSALDAARAAGKDGLVIYTVGVGSRQGALIEVSDGHGGKELVRDEAGQPVHSHLDETMLASIARATGGAYQALGADGRGLDQLYAIARARLPQQTTAGTQRKVYAERFQIPLAIAIACLLAGFAVGDRRRRGARKIGALGVTSVIAVVLAVPMVAAAGTPSPLVQGVDAYTKRDFTAAQKQFENALHTADVARQHDAYYDLGDARYRAGEATAAKDRGATIETWKQALAAYDAAIALAPLDGHARFNRTFVASKIAQLEQQQKQDQQKQQRDKQAGAKDQKQNGSGGQQQKDQQGGNKGQNQNGTGGQQPKDQQAGNKGQQPKDRRAGTKGQNQNGSGAQQPKDQQAGPKGQQQPDRQAGAKDQDQNGSGDQQAQKQRGSDQGAQPQAPDAADHAAHAGGAVGSTESPQAAAARAAEAAADAKRRAAGQLTHGEAVQLLNSVEDELRPMPIHGRADGRPRPTPTKDW